MAVHPMTWPARGRLSLILLTFISALVCVSSGVDVIIPLAGAEPSTPVIKLAPADLNLNVGGPQVGRFQEDEYSWIFGGFKNTSQFVMPDAVIGGAEEKNEPMYKSQRYGKTPDPWGYDIPLSRPGTYGCTIHFAELHSEAFKIGARVFDLSVYSDNNPLTTFYNIDLYKETNGAMFTAVTRTVPKIVVRRTLKIRAQKTSTSKFAAFISGITCERTGELPEGVLAIAAPRNGYEPPSFASIGVVFPSGPLIKGDKLYINTGGERTEKFLPDNVAYLHGSSNVLEKSEQIIGGADPENQLALRSCRFGVDSDFSYEIPIENSGYYDCTLHFAELDPTTEIGTRIFHIQVQNQIYKDFDVMTATGNALFTAYGRSFVKLVVSDFITIRLIQVKGDPFLNAFTCDQTEPLEMGTARRLLAGGLATEPSPTPKASSEPTPVPTSSPTSSLGPAASPASTQASSSVPTSVPEPEASPAPTPTSSATTTPANSPIPSPLVTSTPVPSGSASGTAIPTASNAAPVAVPSISVSPSGSVSPNLLGDIKVDQILDPSSEESTLTYKLELGVANGTNVNNVLKEDVKATLAAGSEIELSSWTLTSFVNHVTSRAVTTAAQTKFDVTVNANVKKGQEEKTNSTIAEYLNSGEGTKELQKKHPGSKLTLLEAVSNSAVAPPPNNTSRTGVIIAAVVGSLLGILIIVAFIAFFIIGRHEGSSTAQSTYLDSDGGAAPSSSVHSESPRSNDSRSPGAEIPMERDDYGRGPSGRLP